MTNSTKVRMLLGYFNMSQTDLAKKLNTSPQALWQRLKTDKLTYQDMEQIANALGVKWSAHFVLPDGTEI